VLRASQRRRLAVLRDTLLNAIDDQRARDDLLRAPRLTLPALMPADHRADASDEFHRIAVLVERVIRASIERAHHLLRGESVSGRQDRNLARGVKQPDQL